MIKDWLKAAERYEAAKQPDFKPRKKREKPEEPKQTLAGFMANCEGEAAKKLLAASGQYILLGESEAVQSHSVSVSLDGEGLKKSVQVVGMAAAYTKEKPQFELITAEKTIELVQSFDDDMSLVNVDAVLITKIREQLDSIAAEAP